MKKMFFLFIVLLLSACTSNADLKSTSNTMNSVDIKENLLDRDIPFYNNASTKLPSNDMFVQFAVKADNKLYLCALEKLGRYDFYEYDIINNSYVQLDTSIQGNICGIDASGDGLYILMSESDNDGNRSYEFKVFNTQTHNVKSIPLDNTFIENSYINIRGFSAVDNQIYVNAIDSIYQLDDTGRVTATLKLDNTCSGLFRSANDNNLRAYSYTDSGVIVQEINSKLQPVRQYILGTKYSRIFPGLYPNQIYISDDYIIYSLDLETGDKKPCVSMLLHTLDISNFISISNELFFTIQNGIPTFWSINSEEDNAPQVTILTCASYDPSFELKTAVSAFNFNHDDIKIDIVDYSVYDDGLTKLIVEITAGKVPDLFDLSSVPITTLSSSGLLENLEEYLSEKNIVPNILETLKDDDGIFELVPGFQIVSMVGNSNYITTPRINPDALLNLAKIADAEGMSLFPQYITRETFISYILSFSGDSFVDIKKNYCNFEDETFAGLIQFAARLPSNDDLSEEIYTEAVIREFSSILNDRQLISIIETGNPVFELLKLKGLYKGTVEFVGFPTNSGNGIAMTPFLRLAISSTSSLKDEIYFFFDYLLSEDFQSEIPIYSYMPVISDCLDKYIDSTITEYRNHPLKLAIPDMATLECPLVDDETATDVWKLITQVDCINEYDTNIYKIVVEECQSFFAGQKDVSAVISLIQNRSSLYVHEKQ